jgi:hypothetical protein
MRLHCSEIPAGNWYSVAEFVRKKMQEAKSVGQDLHVFADYDDPTYRSNQMVINQFADLVVVSDGDRAKIVKSRDGAQT